MGARDFPHLTKGAGMFPEKPASARRCLLCNRKAKLNGVHIDNYGLCGDHDTEKGRDEAKRRLKVFQTARAARLRPRRRARKG